MKFATPETVLRRARVPDRKRRGSSQTARAAVPDRQPVHGRSRFCCRKDLRHRSLAAEPEHVSGDFVLQQHGSLSGAPREYSLPSRWNRKGGVRPHAQRLRARRRPDVDRDCGELPAERWIGRDPGRVAAVHEWARGHQTAIALTSPDTRLALHARHIEGRGQRPGRVASHPHIVCGDAAGDVDAAGDPDGRGAHNGRSKGDNCRKACQPEPRAKRASGEGWRRGWDSVFVAEAKPEAQ